MYHLCLNYGLTVICLQSKPSFGDQSVLIVFVVGGINTLEVCSSPYSLASFVLSFHDEVRCLCRSL